MSKVELTKMSKVDLTNMTAEELDMLYKEIKELKFKKDTASNISYELRVEEKLGEPCTDEDEVWHNEHVDEVLEDSFGEDTVGVLKVSWREFAEALVDNELYAPTHRAVYFYDNYMSVVGTKPNSDDTALYTLVLDRAAWADGLSMKEIYAILMAQDFTEILIKKVAEEAVREYKASLCNTNAA